MRKAVFVFSMWMIFVGAGPARAELITPPPKPDFSRFQLSAELGGASFLYSFFGSYRPIPELALNLGVSDFPVILIFVNGNALAFPISASYLLDLGSNSHFLEFLAGGDLIFFTNVTALPIFGDDSSSSSSSGTGFAPLAGFGYRYWPSDGGFTFRATFYLFFLNQIEPWGGLSFGYAF